MLRWPKCVSAVKNTSGFKGTARRSEHEQPFRDRSTARGTRTGRTLARRSGPMSARETRRGRRRGPGQDHVAPGRCRPPWARCIQAAPACPCGVCPGLGPPECSRALSRFSSSRVPHSSATLSAPGANVGWDDCSAKRVLAFDALNCQAEANDGRWFAYNGQQNGEAPTRNDTSSRAAPKEGGPLLIGCFGSGGRAPRVTARQGHDPGRACRPDRLFTAASECSGTRLRRTVGDDGCQSRQRAGSRRSLAPAASGRDR
jgi:hypothetical protein